VTTVGQRLDDRYEVVRPIGAGVMTRVFEAWDRHERRRVAVKLPIRRFADDQAFVARLEREVTAVAGLAHPNVAAVHGVEWDGRAGFVVAELVDGSSLWEMVAARGSLPPAGAAMVAAQVCLALAAAHAGGLTHGHLTPANVLLCIDGRVKLTDFRLAQAAKAPLAAPGPEDDLRALGRCLVVMLTGREQPPAEPVRLGQEVPAELARIVRRAASPRDGYGSAGDLGRDLVRFLASVRPGLALAGQPAAALGPDPGDLAATALSRAVELTWSLPEASPVRPPGAAGPPPRGRPGAAGARPPPPAGPGDAVPPAGRRRLALVAGLVGAWLAVAVVVAAWLPRGGPDRPAAGPTPAPPVTALVVPTTGEPAAGTAPSLGPTTTAPPTTVPRAGAPPPVRPPGGGGAGIPGRRTVPGVVGLSASQATEVLGRAGLRARLVEVRARGRPQRVVAQDPAAGEVVPAGSRVTVAVATKGSHG
jgi:serine/threonine-protein kinase